uniref:BTB domain-containing protein n=1 Tax=Arundo donax TaxID=35708 RepID=A0A0A9A749_ARUDO
MALVARTIDSAFHQLEVDYEQSKQLAVGTAIHSDAFAAGGHMWRVKLYPRGAVVSDNGTYLSLYIELLNKSVTRSVSAIFEVFLMDKDGQPSPLAATRTKLLFQSQDWGWPRFIPLAHLERDHLTEGHIRLICAIMVLSDSSIPVPPSDFAKHLGTLLDSTDGTDVSFTIDGETLHAHRAVLAARSPVFRAELLGSMAEAQMASIALQEITPATFRFMLRFIYTDALPGDEELGDPPTKSLMQLLAAADRYALDRLKVMCAKKVWDENMSVHVVSNALALADMYNCQELKTKCLDFMAAKENSVVFTTRGYFDLFQKFPHLIAEVRQRLAA